MPKFQLHNARTRAELHSEGRFNRIVSQTKVTGGILKGDANSRWTTQQLVDVKNFPIHSVHESFSLGDECMNSGPCLLQYVFLAYACVRF